MVEPITKPVPKKKRQDRETSPGKKKRDTKHDTTIETEVANPFKTLSAYFTTSATIIPPKACKHTTVQTIGEYPWKNPCACTAAASFEKTPAVPTTIPIKAS
jgi:hypothetical protein